MNERERINKEMKRCHDELKYQRYVPIEDQLTPWSFSVVVNCPHCQGGTAIVTALLNTNVLWRCDECAGLIKLIGKDYKPVAVPEEEYKLRLHVHKIPEHAPTMTEFKFENFHVALERTTKGFDIQLFDGEGKPLTPRLSCHQLEQILYHRKLTPIRLVIKSIEERSKLLLLLQEAASELTQIKQAVEGESWEKPFITLEREAFNKIHPAGDAAGNFIFEYSTAPSKQDPMRQLNVLAWYDNEKKERGIIPFEDKTRNITIEGKTFQLIKEIDVETGSLNLLSLAGLKKWVDNYTPSPREVWDKVFAFSKRYIYFLDPENYYVLTAWIIATYFSPQLASFPYINPTGFYQSGKTRVINVICQLAYHSNPIINPREASVFREVDKFRCTLINDEGDSIVNYDSALQAIYNSGYAKGMKVPRQLRLPDGKFKTEYFDVYSPKVISSRFPLPDMLDSRSIKLIMKGMAPSGLDYSQYEEEIINLETGKDLRDDLYIARLLYTTLILKEISQINLHQHQIRGREALLFKPLIAVARVFCGTGGLEEEQILKAARKHYDLSLLTKRGSREVKAVIAILAALESEMPKTYEQVRKAVSAINAKMKPEESTLTEEVTLTIKKIHEKYTELFQKDMPPQDERYISNDKLGSTLRKTLGYEADRKKEARSLKFTLNRLIHDIQIFELYEDMDVEPPQEEELDKEGGLEKFTQTGADDT